MCTWKTNRRQTPPTMQRYIAAKRPTEGLEHLHELRHGRRCRPRFFSRSYSGLLLEVVVEDGETTCSASRRSNGRDGLVAGWPKTSRGENQSGDNAELESRRDLAMATSWKGFPFYSSTECNGHPNRLR
jgi:hypothetical protein